MNNDPSTNSEFSMLITRAADTLPTVFLIVGLVLAITFIIIGLAVLGEGWREAVKDLGKRWADPIRTAAERVDAAMRGTWWVAAATAAHFVPPGTPPEHVPGAVIVALATSLIYLGIFVVALGGELPNNAERYAAMLRQRSNLTDQSVGDLSAIALSGLGVLYGFLAFDACGWAPGIGPWLWAGRWGRIALGVLAWLGVLGTIVALVILNVYAQVRLEFGANLSRLSVIYAGLFQALLAVGTVLTGFCLLFLAGLLLAGVVAVIAGLIGLVALALRLFATFLLILGSLVQQLVEVVTLLADHLYHNLLLESPLADLLGLRQIVRTGPRQPDA